MAYSEAYVLANLDGFYVARVCVVCGLLGSPDPPRSSLSSMVFDRFLCLYRHVLSLGITLYMCVSV